MATVETGMDSASTANPKSLLGCSVQEMSVEETHAFVGLCLQEWSKTTDMAKTFPPNTEFVAGGGAKILNDRRLACNNKLNITNGLACWVLFLSDSPGDIVMWVWTLRELALRQPEPDPVLALKHWAAAFPLGVPTQTAKENTWDGQKFRLGANMLDEALIWAF